ncbi:MAG: ATP-binding protein [Bacteroidales bacterium]|nr:ATP-binding protein [Bacteroidales bacterium]MDD2425986.1 ATP-binding protein [Bacteroidales bacterium]MDD3990221.1 ATP-binding protein [Bacteroidales bacterium]MDD4638894.1 ATP-binding protein [Bacteroidales bacterium]
MYKYLSLCVTALILFSGTFLFGGVRSGFSCSGIVHSDEGLTGVLQDGVTQDGRYSETGDTSYISAEKENNQERERKNILIVYSQSMDFERMREFSSGFTSYISKNKIDCSVHIVRISQPETTEGKIKLLSDIFSSRSIFKINNLIVAPDRLSFRIVKAVDSLIPRGIPVVALMGEELPVPSVRYSRLVLEYPFEKNLKLGLKLFPLTTKVFVLTDDIEYGKMENIQARKLLDEYSKDLSIDYFLVNQNNCESIIETINSSGGNSLVILSSWHLDNKGNYIFSNNVTPFISRIKAPVFGIQELSLGCGVLGGELFSMWDAGYHSAFRAVKILQNPFIRYNEKFDGSKLAFDYDIVRKFNLRKDYLPAGSDFINDPANMFDNYSTEINFIIALIVLLTSSLVVFALYHLRYIRVYKNSLKLQKENEERKELLNNTLSVMSEGVVSFDRNFRIIDINSAAKLLSRYSGDFIGKNFEEVFNTSQPKEQETVVNLLDKVIQLKKRVNLSNPTRINYNNRESRVITGSISPVVDSQGDVSQLVLVFYDITDSFKQKRFLNLAVESAHSYTWYYNTYNNKFVFDDHFRIFAGEEYYSEVSMNYFIRNIHPDDREKFISCHQDIIESKTSVFMVEYRIMFDQKKGFEWWERRGLSLIDTSAEGDELYIYGMDINIARHKTREQELIDARNRAEESDRLKSAFLSNISHEIRTPLNGIVGFSNLLADNEYSPEEKINFIKVINENARLLMSLISDILDLSRIESNSMSFDFKQVNLNKQFREILAHYSIYSKNHLIITTDLPDVSAVVAIDEFRNRQVISNLLNNSLKFTEKGHIKFGYHIVDDCVEVFVEDTGKGIQKDKLNSVFERFYKVDEFIPGSGLGLAICKAIVEHLGGKIWIESSPGKGTTVKYTIKYNKEKLNTEIDHILTTGDHYDLDGIQSTPKDKQLNIRLPKTLEHQKVISSPNDDKTEKVEKPDIEVRGTILIAEDLESNYMLLRIMLAKHWKLLWAKNGKEAVEMFETLSPDLILMDIKMPLMDGLEATRIIRGKSPDIPIIAQTANAFESDRIDALQAGCNEMLVKPITAQKLNQTIDEYYKK